MTFTAVHSVTVTRLILVPHASITQHGISPSPPTGLSLTADVAGNFEVRDRHSELQPVVCSRSLTESHICSRCARRVLRNCPTMADVWKPAVVGLQAAPDRRYQCGRMLVVPTGRGPAIETAIFAEITKQFETARYAHP